VRAKPMSRPTRGSGKGTQRRRARWCGVATLLLSGAVALLFALTHAFGARLSFLHRAPRSIWLSIAGGVSVAYVFVHLLPELAAHQEELGHAFEEGGVLAAIESHVWLAALIGLAFFYGLERLARRSGCSEADLGGDVLPARGVFWVHLGSFAVYNLIVGYLLHHREDARLQTLAFYAVALSLHFLVNDHALRQQHGRAYHREGRWLLGVAPLAGWTIGLGVAVPPLAITALFALVAGGMILNVLKEELPEDRESRFWAFALGAGLYAALLLAVA
jgi:zinc transporter ZupT